MTTEEPVKMIRTNINGRWQLRLPQHRAERREWPYWEATRLAHMHMLLGGGKETVYDIGAEEGDFPGLWAGWGNDTVLFEPNDRVWANIRAIFETNSLRRPLACFEAFAGCQERGELNVWVPKEKEGWPPAAYGPIIGDHGFCNLYERPEIASVTIDEVAGRLGIRPPTAITMDVEGAELQVLKGASSTLREWRPLVWVSIHPDFMAEMYPDDTPGRLLNFMHEHGYDFEHLCTDHEEHWFFAPDERGLIQR